MRPPRVHYVCAKAPGRVRALFKNQWQSGHAMNGESSMISKYVAGVAIVAAGMTLSTTPAEAITTLDFSGNICGVAGNAACFDGTQIGQNYGDSAFINLSHRSGDALSNATIEPYLKLWRLQYGDLERVIWGGTNPAGQFSEITFAPTAGYEVRLISLDAGCYRARASCQTLNYDIRDLSGNIISAGSQSTNSPTHSLLSVNSGWYSNGIVLKWGPDGFDVGLDNIAFDVRAIQQVGGVPEPTTWAMMIMGFGAVGSSLRRRAKIAVKYA
jgi:hypothetical protein